MGIGHVASGQLDNWTVSTHYCNSLTRKLIAEWSGGGSLTLGAARAHLCGTPTELRHSDIEGRP
jgi:hypothetical protein